MSGDFTKAQALFLRGYNCAQSVFAANAPRFGIAEDDALRISAGLGGGVGRLREVCGAFSACAMLAGLAQNAVRADKEKKEALYAFVQRLADDFKKRNGSIICRELLDIAKGSPTPPAPDARTAQYYASRPCLKIVGEADRIADSIIP